MQTKNARAAKEREDSRHVLRLRTHFHYKNLIILAKTCVCGIMEKNMTEVFS